MGQKLRSTATCTNTQCPLMHEYLRDETDTLHLYQPKEDMYQDRRGNYWCECCKSRWDLMNWGETHHFPAVSCHPYAVGAGHALWFAALSMGRSDYIARLYETIREREQAA